MIENVVIGNVDSALYHHLFAYDFEDWIYIEKEKTLFTQERYLPKILFQAIGVSAKEIRRNRKDLDIVLDKVDFIEVTYGKNKNRRVLYIVIGGEE